VSFARSTNNRAITAYGLKLMNLPSPRPAWQALRQHLKKSDRFTTADIAFTLGPLTNAAGRIDDAMAGVRFLMSPTVEEASHHLQLLAEANKERREIEASMKELALPIAEREVERGRAGVVVYLENGHPGIHGVVCSRVTEALGRPAACFSPKQGSEEIVTGSLRSIAGVHIRDCLAEIHQKHPDIQIGFGGHEGAAGTHMKRVDLDRFADAFDLAVKSRVRGRILQPFVLVDGGLPVSPSLQVLDEIIQLAPFGREFDVPVFTLDASVDTTKAVGNGAHLQLSVVDRYRRRLPCIWFFAMKPGEPAPVKTGELWRFAVELAANTYRGDTSLQLIIRSAVPFEN